MREVLNASDYPYAQDDYQKEFKITYTNYLLL